MTALTDTTFPGYFQASFSPNAGYYVLGYKGPEVPWQRLIETGSGDDRAFFFLLSNCSTWENAKSTVKKERMCYWKVMQN